MPESKRPKLPDIVPAKKVVVMIPAENILRSIGTSIEVVEKNTPEVGKIVSIGLGKLPIIGMGKGDIVAYRKYGESKYYVGGQQIIFCGFDDLLGIIKV